MKLTRCALAVSAFILTALAAVAPAQENAWTSHGPTGVGVVNDVAVGDSVAYAATPNGVFRSDDEGASWHQSRLAGESIAQLLVPSGAAVVMARGTSGILYAARDGADLWAPVHGLPPVTLAAIDPGQPSTVYAGVDDATIWKSADAGSSWDRLSILPGGHGPQVFAFDSRAIYTIAFNDLDNLYEVYKSLDGGVSWATASFPVPYPTTIAAGAAPGLVYTGGLNRFCRSADFAATWTCSSFPEWPGRIVEVPGDGPGATPRILASSPTGVYVSHDGGATWAHAEGELGSIGYVPALASDPSGALVLAAGTNSGIFRSQDRGDSWTPASVGLRSSVIDALALDPQDPSTVWAGGGFDGNNSRLFRSGDGGLSWSLGNGPAADFRALVVDPEHPSTLYAGGSAVYRSDDGGAHWTSSTVPGGAVEALALDPASPERIWAASYGGLLRSDDGAESWTSAPAMAQEIYSILFDGKKPGTMYAGSYYDVEPGWYAYPSGGSIFVSYDSGANWTKRAQDLGSHVVAIATDPFQDGGLYAATYSAGIFRSADRGLTWQGPGLGLPLFPSVIFSLVADPVRSDRLYVTTDSGVFRTLDGAQTWQPFSSGLGSLQARSLVISPDGKWLHAGTIGGGVFELDLEAEVPPIPCATNATHHCRRQSPRPVERPRPVRTPRGS